MGETTEALKVVLDTNTVLSALLFKTGRLTWIRELWESRRITPLVSPSTVDELVRALAYPKFRLEPSDVAALLASYLLRAEVVSSISPRRDVPKCRDAQDQMFLDLAQASGAAVLVTGDRDLLTLRDEAGFAIEAPSQFQRRFTRG